MAEYKNSILLAMFHCSSAFSIVYSVKFPHFLKYPTFWCISLRTTLCVRFKSEVVACGVVYAAARRHRVPLPEDPPWWTVFDADEAGIQEVCRVLAHLYSLPKAQYIPVYKDNDSFSVRRASDPQASKVKNTTKSFWTYEVIIE